MKESVLKWCLLLAVCCIHWTGMAQTNEIDSLLAVLKVSRPDTNRIKTLNQLGQQLCRAKQYSEAVKLGREADSLSTQFNFIRGRSDANNVIGCSCYNQKKYEEAMKYYENSLTQATDAGYKPGIARSNLNLGLLEERLGK
jgi:tetratricopeptide (TPR) repeat protein